MAAPFRRAVQRGKAEQGHARAWTRPARAQGPRAHRASPPHRLQRHASDRGRSRGGAASGGVAACSGPSAQEQPRMRARSSRCGGAQSACCSWRSGAEAAAGAGARGAAAPHALQPSQTARRAVRPRRAVGDAASGAPIDGAAMAFMAGGGGEGSVCGHAKRVWTFSFVPCALRGKKARGRGAFFRSLAPIQDASDHTPTLPRLCCLGDARKTSNAARCAAPAQLQPPHMWARLAAGCWAARAPHAP